MWLGWIESAVVDPKEREKANDYDSASSKGVVDREADLEEVAEMQKLKMLDEVETASAVTSHQSLRSSSESNKKLRWGPAGANNWIREFAISRKLALNSANQRPALRTHPITGTSHAGQGVLSACLWRLWLPNKRDFMERSRSS